MDSHSVIFACRGKIGGHAPEFSQGFKCAGHTRLGLCPYILSDERDQIRATFKQFLEKHIELDYAGELRLGMAIDEISENLLVHGLEGLPYLWGEAELAITCTTRGEFFLVCRVYDEGKMFTLSEEPDCTDVDHRESETGRGLHTIRNVGGFQISDPLPIGSGNGKEMVFQRPIFKRGDSQKYSLNPPPCA
jgi:anti-sigma regulatory factor (Ser/Thr protein kinase)